MAYIALYGFKYNYNGVVKEDLFKFLHSNYDNFSNKLNEYAILETIKEYYEKGVTPLINYNYNEFLIRLIQNFHDDITIPIINFSYINTIENRLTKLENEVSILKKNLKNSNFHLNINIKFINITNSIDKNVILENFIIHSDLSSTIIKINEKKMSYLGCNINMLKNAIKNLSNPYNFYLWRKISNIILKNIFVILNNKNYTINQKPNYYILSQLNKTNNKN